MLVDFIAALIWASIVALMASFIRNKMVAVMIAFILGLIQGFGMGLVAKIKTGGEKDGE